MADSMTLNLKNPKPLYEQIADDIKQQIATGKLKVNEQLSSQQELANTYSVSLITVKKALAKLYNEGVLYSRIGKGTFVARASAPVDFKKHQTIGFVLRQIDSPFFSRILASVERKTGEIDYNLLLSSSAGEAQKEDRLIEHFLKMGVNGLIIASMSRVYFASPVVRKLQENNFPYVVVSYIADRDISYVGTDHEEGAFLGTSHLVKMGYRNIGYINGEEGSLLGELRKKGFLRALHKGQLLFNPDYEYRLRLRGEWNDYQSGYEIGRQFLSTPDRPEAIFAYNDLSALGFEKAVLEAGFKIPEDVAIVGFDNIKRGVTASVPLTTIHQPTDKIGELAVEMIYKKVEGMETPTQQILKPRLIIRDSCGARKKFPDLAEEGSQFGTF